MYYCTGAVDAATALCIHIAAKNKGLMHTRESLRKREREKEQN